MYKNSINIVIAIRSCQKRMRDECVVFTGNDRHVSAMLSERDFEPYLCGAEGATTSASPEIHNNSYVSHHGALERVIHQVWSPRVLRKSHVTAHRFHGGMTNVVFKLSIAPSDANDTQSVIARVRQGSDSLSKELLDIDMEHTVFSLASDLGIGPRCFVTYDNGRIEEFLEGWVVHDGMEKIRLHVARELARFHALMTDAFYGATSDGMRTPKTVWERFHRWVAYLRSTSDWMESWMHDLLEDASTCPHEHVCTGHSRASCTALIHGDLQCGNILFTGSRVRLIDYDYSTFGEVYFDIGNHFCEYAADYHTNPRQALFDWNRIPSEKVSREFCQEYWDTLSKEYPSSSITTSLKCTGEDDAAIIESLVAMSRKYMRLSHLFWSVWGLVMHRSGYSTVDFEYIPYAHDRYEQWKAWGDPYSSR